MRDTRANILEAIGVFYDTLGPIEYWPPPFPKSVDLSRISGHSRPTISYHKDGLVEDGYLIKVDDVTYALSPKGTQWLYTKGYLRRFIKATDKGFGVVVKRVEIVYPT